MAHASMTRKIVKRSTFFEKLFYYERSKSFVTPLYLFIQNTQVFMHSIKVRFLYYLFMYLIVYLYIAFILISSNDFEPEVIFDYAENARMRKNKG